MTKGAKQSRLLALAAIASLVSAAPASSAEPPDLEQNWASGYVESVDIAVDTGGLVRHVEDTGQGGTRTSTLVSTAPGANPRIAIAPGGNTFVVWGQGSPASEVFLARRDLASKAWTAAARISSDGENSRHPEVVHSGAATWVAYEIAAGTSTLVAVTGITDSPEPFPTRSIVASTGFAGDVDVLAHSFSGHLWLTWIESATQVGWSEYDAGSGSWNPPAYRSYAGTTVAVARRAIQTTVIGP